jgi:hypothetical protein
VPGFATYLTQRTMDDNLILGSRFAVLFLAGE